jgi:hypothetical protein
MVDWKDDGIKHKFRDLSHLKMTSKYKRNKAGLYLQSEQIKNTIARKMENEVTEELSSMMDYGCPDRRSEMLSTYSRGTARQNFNKTSQGFNKSSTSFNSHALPSMRGTPFASKVDSNGFNSNENSPNPK